MRRRGRADQGVGHDVRGMLGGHCNIPEEPEEFQPLQQGVRRRGGAVLITAEDCVFVVETVQILVRLFVFLFISG